VGRLVGALVGGFVGVLVGAIVGEFVGACVGADVGVPNGSRVPPPQTQHASFAVKPSVPTNIPNPEHQERSGKSNGKSSSYAVSFA
jgi:hypothetical protein